ncbi:ABC transporter ATP-binding protein [Paenibacillus antarcticus]|uniref:Glutathione ABC transporter ATP-binding protein n=1 Tax=Paenibacillus antarcticus TaxID=253703 RepID=A0A168QAC7_9BACL|nr:ABC transporter ATP-binding protein [Paenibacillus antarcticus]OAB47558.1 glutathione ABC transporter ATP-binding protein [Paenibacillus antarcticus]
MTQLLDIQHLSVDFNTKKGLLRAITDVSLTIQAGETVCLVGESGSGKTITSKSVMRLIDYENGIISEGNIMLNGIDLVAMPQKELRSLRGKKMAMIFQEPMAAFDPVFTIGSQIVEVIMTHQQGSRSKAWKHAVYLLQRVGIPEPDIRMKQYPNELSGGMLQRAMIAMALACGPELLIADEPTTALDVTIQAQILQLLQELKTEFNMSILLITHDMGIAAEIADRIIVMYAGQVVEQATVFQLFEQPHHPYTKGLLQSITTMDSDRSNKLYSIEGSIPSLSDLPTGCRFHPRCPYATERCVKDNPPLQVVNGRLTACWHAEVLVQCKDWSQKHLKVDSLDAPAIEVHATSEAREELVDGDNLFAIEGLSKFYPIRNGILSRNKTVIRAVDDVSLNIRKGETFGLVGESGSGKSTLGRVILQLEQATSGRVMYQGRDLGNLNATGLREARKNMQMIFQDPYSSVDPRWNVGDIIGEPLSVHEDLNTKERRSRVEELLEVVGLDRTWVDRYPHEFSGGQRQRIGIARAIALHPEFILADEAVSALDVSVQSQIVNLMQDLQKELNLTYLFIAHGLNIVRHISDRIGVMYLGKLVEIAPSEALFLHPAHYYTKALIASIPLPDPTRTREYIAIQGEIPSPAHPPSGCHFHTRCPAATARCREEQPVLREVGRGHLTACHYPAL